MSENLHIAITGDNQGFINALNGARAGVRATAREVEQSGGSIEQMFSRIKIAATGALAGFSAKAFIQQVATIRGEFQQLEASFTTLLGSAEKAQSMMNDLTKLAATTPFGLQDVSQGAKQLLAYGVAAQDVTSTMRKLGDISAGLSLNLNDLVWLYGTTLTQGRMFTQDLRQFQSRGIPMAEELSKIFGVTKDQVAGLVSAGKVGSKEVIEAIDNMTKAGSQFGGLMDMQSHTITGQISNIEDTIDMAFNDFGKHSEGIINDVLSLTSTLVEHWQEVGAAIMYAAETIGIYKAASVAISRFESNATNLGIDAEIAQYSAILPQKEAAANADLQQAVAEGKLTEAKAAKVAAMREEAQAYVVELQQKAEVAAASAKEAADEYSAAVSKQAAASMDLENAESKVEAAKEALQSALEGGQADEISAAQTNLKTAADNENVAAQRLKAASAEVSTAATKASTTAEAANSAQTQLNTVQTGVNTAATAADTTAKGLWAQVTALATRAQEAFNASMFASPLFWIAAVIAGVTFAIYELATADTAAEAAQKNVNNAIDDFNKKLDERKQKAEELIHTIQSENATDFEKAEAYEELSKLMPSITEKYTQAELAALDFGKAQKDIGENIDTAKIDEARKKVEEFTKAIQDTKDAMADDAKYNGGRGGLALANQLEEQQAELEQWENKVLEYENIVEQARQQAEEANKPIEVKLEEAQDNYRVKQDIYDFYKEAMNLAEQLQAGNEEINYATGATKLDEFIAKAQAELADLRQQEAANPLDLNLRLKEEEKTKVLNGILDMKAQMNKQGTCIIPLWFQVDWNSLTKGVNDAKNKVAQLAQQKIDNNFGTQFNNKKKARDDAYKKLQKINKNKSAYTVQEYQSAKKAYDDAEKDFTQNYGGTSIKVQTSTANKAHNAARSSATKLQNQAQQAAREAAQRRARLKEENQRWDEELAKERVSSINAQEEARISAIADGAEKEREERKLQYRKDLEQVSQQERDFRKQNYEHNKTVFENSTKAKKGKKPEYTGTIAGTSLTKDQQAQVDAQRKKAENDWNRYLLEQQQKEAESLNDYLKEYGSTQEKRLAIAKEYDEKIAKAQTEGERLSLNAQKARALSDFDINNAKSEINWEDVFGNLDSFTKDQLGRIKQQLKEMLSSGDLDIDGYKDVVDQIDKVNDAILSAEDKQRSFLGVSVSYNMERRKLEMDVADALERQNQAMQEMGVVSATLTMQRFSTQQLLSGYGVNVQQGDVRASNANSILKQVGDKYGEKSEPYKKVKDALDKLAKSETAYNNVVKKKEKADNDATQKQTKLNKYLADFAERLKDIMPLLEQINSNIQDIPGLLSTLGVSEDSSLGKAASAFADGSQSAMDAAKDYMSGNYVGAAMNGLKAVGSYVQSATNLFAGAGNEAKMEAEIARLSESNSDLAEAIDSLSDTISDSDNTNKQSVDAYKKAIDAEKERESNQRTMINDRASEWSNSGHGFLGTAGRHSFNVYANRNIGNWLSDFNAALTENGYKGNLRSVADVWNLSPEEMKVLRDFSPEAWTKFFNSGGQSNPKELAEQYIEMAGKMQDLTESLNEKLTGYSWDSFKDGYESVLEDMSSDTDSLGKHIEEVLTKAVVSSMMNDEFKDRIKEIYDYLANAASDGDLTADELAKIRSMNTSLSKDMMDRRKQLVDAGLINDSSTYSQNASSGSWKSMGEDTAQELNGRFTALQEAGERISDGIQTMVVTVNSLYGKVDDSNVTLTEIRNLMITNNAFLEDILTVNKKYYENFKQSLTELKRTR